MEQAQESSLLVQSFPRLTRFYGIGPSELAKTPNNILQIYADAIAALEAEELLNLILAADMPHAEQKDRTRIIERLQYIAGIEDEPERIDHTTEGGKAIAAGLGIGIHSEKIEDA